MKANKEAQDNQQVPFDQLIEVYNALDIDVDALMQLFVTPDPYHRQRANIDAAAYRRTLRDKQHFIERRIQYLQWLAQEDANKILHAKKTYLSQFEKYARSGIKLSELGLKQYKFLNPTYYHASYQKFYKLKTFDKMRADEISHASFGLAAAGFAIGALAVTIEFGVKCTDEYLSKSYNAASYLFKLTALGLAAKSAFAYNPAIALYYLAFSCAANMIALNFDLLNFKQKKAALEKKHGVETLHAYYEQQTALQQLIKQYGQLTARIGHAARTGHVPDEQAMHEQQRLKATITEQTRSLQAIKQRVGEYDLRHYYSNQKAIKKTEKKLGYEFAMLALCITGAAVAMAVPGVGPIAVLAVTALVIAVNLLKAAEFSVVDSAAYFIGKKIGKISDGIATGARMLFSCRRYNPDKQVPIAARAHQENRPHSTMRLHQGDEQSLPRPRVRLASPSRADSRST